MPRRATPSFSSSLSSLSSFVAHPATFWSITIVLLLLIAVLVCLQRRSSSTVSTPRADTFASYPTADNNSTYDTTLSGSGSVLPSFPFNGPPYEPSKYTADPYVQNSHNCYAYAMDFYDPGLARRCKSLLTNSGRKTCYAMRPKPGKASRTHQHLPRHYRMTCPKMMDGVLGDVPGAFEASRDVQCPSNHYKIAFAVDPHRTYHFYRQDADGGWSHKDAWRPVTRLDARGQRIDDPAEADREYSHANLSDFCGYVCVPSQGYRPTHLR